MNGYVQEQRNIGREFAQRLGLNLPQVEGHDLAGPCIACESSDAFRLHQENGVAQCYSCHRKWSPLRVAETVLKDREQAIVLCRELGILRSDSSPDSVSKSSPDPVEVIARQKGVTTDSIRVYGARRSSPKSVKLPAYGPDGTKCSTFYLFVNGGKGLFAKGMPAGLFFPHEDNTVRLPRPGETWHLVEGVKDAAALAGMGLLACGLNTCRLNAKFARIFQGVDVVLIPDRDTAGEDGAKSTARVLHGVAGSTRIAVLPAEFKPKGGDDVRDVLGRPDGGNLVRQAIADATPACLQDEEFSNLGESGQAAVVIRLPEGEPLQLTVYPLRKGRQRLVIANRGRVEYRDQFNTDSGTSRIRWLNKLAAKVGIGRDVVGSLVESDLLRLAAQVDKAFADTESAAAPVDDHTSIAVELVSDWNLWHTPDHEAYATIPVGEHFETWKVRSPTLKRLLIKLFFDATGEAIKSETVGAVLNLLESRALYDGEEQAVYVRVAELHGNLYLDLCNAQWQVVEITRNGWQIIDESPVRFRRSKGMLPLLAPDRGGEVDELRSFLNVSDRSWILILGWLIATFRPRGPYPLLALFAEQGSGKSTAARLIRSLIDPNAAPLRADPKAAHDLMIGANNSWCLAFDNLSTIPSWFSDALCRLCTGGGFAVRELFTDEGEIIFDAQRPVILTSVEEIASRSDLLDRCLVVHLPTICEDQRRPESEILAAFEAARPRILGALLDAVSAGIRNLPDVKLQKLPRMADFAIWVTAAETSFGWKQGTFLNAYEQSRAEANDVALEASLIAQPLLDILDWETEWSGTATELLREIEAKSSDQVTQQKGWPKNGRSLSGHLNRLAPNLRAAGWEITTGRTAKARVWRFRRMTQTARNDATGSSACVTDSGCNEMQPEAKSGNLSPHDADDAESRDTLARQVGTQKVR